MFFINMLEFLFLILLFYQITFLLVCMISPKYHNKNKIQFENILKLPQIPSKRQIQSTKKQPLNIGLPLIKNQRKNLSVNKQNKSQNIVQRKNSIQDQIKASVHDVEVAQNVVKNILGAPQETMQLGGDMTNFEVKIEQNRQLIRKYRNKTQFRQQPKEPQVIKDISINVEHKPKSVSSKQNIIKQSKSLNLAQEITLRLAQNHKNVRPTDYKASLDQQNRQDQKIRFKSEKKMKKNDKIQHSQMGQKVFKSIKQILQDPQRAAGSFEFKKLKQVKFTIQQLQNKLKKMNNMQFNKSNHEHFAIPTESDYKTLKGVKSVGMIPISDGPLVDDYTFQNWNRVDFNMAKKQNQQAQNFNNLPKQVKYHKSNFDAQIDQIQRLQLKSYKSIQRMIENKKLLIDLKLLSNKHKSSLFTDKNQKIRQSNSIINQIKQVIEE